MHPEIVREGPGSCPICGMALEPMGLPPAESTPDPELIDFLHRLKIGIVLTLPLFISATWNAPLLLSALQSQDTYLAGSFLMFLATLTVVGMFISDVALAFLDPRIRLE